MKKYIIIAILVIFLLITLSQKSSTQTNTQSSSTFKTSQDTVNKVNVYESYISSASQNHNIPEARIKAHIAVESDGNSNAIGSDGEIGLMQMTQDALNEVNNRFSPNAPLALSDLYQPNYSIEAGAAYLQILYEQLGDLNQASQAYNVGHDNINSSNGNLYLSKILAYEKLF